jgi:hypothetical protein
MNDNYFPEDEIDDFDESIVPIPTTPSTTESITPSTTPSTTESTAKSTNLLEDIPAETVEITDNKHILPHLKPQESKYWHFKLNDTKQAQLTAALENTPGYSLTVEYGIPQNTPDITLKHNGKTVGKIHLLLCDRRDANLPAKYYCKIYFYSFKDVQLYNSVK